MKKFLLILLFCLTLPALAQSDFQFRISSFMSQDALFMNTYGYSESTGTDLRSIHRVDMVDPSFPIEAIDTLHYDENGNIIRLATHQLLNGSYKLVCFCDYTYNEMGLRETRKNYNVWDNEIPTNPDATITYFYDDDNRLIREEQFFYTAIDQITEYTYNQNGMIESYIIKRDPNWPPTGNYYENSFKQEYFYNDDNYFAETHKYTWDAGAWNMQSIEVRDYDDAGNCTAVTTTTPSGVPQVKYVYKYDEKVLAEDIFFYPNPEGDFPVYPQMHNMLTSFEFWTADDTGSGLVYVLDYLLEYEQIGEGSGSNPADVDIAIEAIDANSIKATVTPNEYTTEYHIGNVSKDIFDQVGIESLVQALQADLNPQTGVKEFIYSELTPETEYVVIVTAKNDADEWITETETIKTLEVGYEDIEADIFNIYPNPTKDFITIDSENINYVEVVDIYGRIVSASEVNGKTRIEMSDFADGIYYVRLHSNGETTIQKVVKN